MACGVCCEVNIGGEFTAHAFSDVGNTEKQGPAAGANRAGEIRRRGVSDGDGEGRFVASAPAAQALGIEKADVDGGALVFACVREFDGDAGGAGRDLERHFPIGLIVGSSDGAVENEVWRGGEQRC
jgi:hypothetical protein